MDQELKVLRKKDSLQVSGMVESGNEENWRARTFTENYFVLEKLDPVEVSLGGVCHVHVDSYYDLLLSFHKRQWTGALAVNTGFGKKKIFFKRGEIVFASSNVIDDRLGEIAYRMNFISLDQLLEYSVKVSRAKKFGQLLLENKIVTDFDLWTALQFQIKHIIKSTFMVESVYFEIENKEPPSSVIFTEGTQALLENSFDYGSNYRCFMRTLKPSTMISPLYTKRVLNEPFHQSLVEMIGTKISFRDFSDKLKFNYGNTISVLMNLVNRGICLLEDIRPFDFDESHPNLENVTACLKRYNYILTHTYKAFEEEGMKVPIESVGAHAVGLSSETSVVLLNSYGNLTRDSVFSIYSQCMFRKERAEFYKLRIRSLIEFLLQIVKDRLSEDISLNIRNLRE